MQRMRPENDTIPHFCCTRCPDATHRPIAGLPSCPPLLRVGCHQEPTHPRSPEKRHEGEGLVAAVGGRGLAVDGHPRRPRVGDVSGRRRGLLQPQRGGSGDGPGGRGGRGGHDGRAAGADGRSAWASRREQASCSGALEAPAPHTSRGSWAPRSQAPTAASRAECTAGTDIAALVERGTRANRAGPDGGHARGAEAHGARAQCMRQPPHVYVTHGRRNRFAWALKAPVKLEILGEPEEAIARAALASAGCHVRAAL